MTNLRIFRLTIFILEEAQAKALAIVSKTREVKRQEAWRAPQVQEVHASKLPELSKTKVDEEGIDQYMNVLRKTHRGIGDALLQERTQQKAEERELKKLQNVNIVKQKLSAAKNQEKHKLRKKIKAMRRDRIFPQPKSFTNYKKNKGLLDRNSIKIEN